MTDIVNEILTMEGDALLIQFNADEMGFPSYSEADAIIRRVSTEDGFQWCFHTLAFVDERLVEITGEKGTIDDIAKTAQYQFGHRWNQSERFSVKYSDYDFPPYLIPEESRKTESCVF